MLTLLFYIFIAITAIQVIYFLIFGAFAFAKTKKSKQYDIPVSVLICAKNEAKNLETLLPELLQQSYKNFELVLINDASSDETLEIMKRFQKSTNNIKIVDVENNEAFWGNKKYALTLGIKAATNDFLVFTDADCVPTSKHWLTEMTQHFSSKKKIVIGYGAYAKKKNSFLNLLIRFETFMAAVQAFSYAKMGIPYTAVGRNLAYHRDEFYRVNGFVNHMKIRSGDDDLFIKDAATSKNTAICFSKNSFTISEPKTSFSKWFQQKRRHVSTSSHYKFIHKFLLGTFYLTQFLFWTIAIFLFCTSFWQMALLIFAFRISIQYFILGFASSKLKEQDTLYLLPILEIFLVIIHFGIFIANLTSKPTHWK
ncbi:Poly-beta-1,6-N-acetyl-D-glucosamine synthase [Kordia antarctica]|uniref:Poly-beta-1,6-N-acetyl-D-glucosamine synthase n=1 Tax=Kordia antarctica TaxID=1218801 RepID=A0A7L4ZPD8_9FLAO|nr:glycosyltransferase [Kordia antarctica]QHI38608.1 Poly-beta-1,6-N-acetyl-D-glucosamine synthase [Kordia antarctica]